MHGILALSWLVQGLEQADPIEELVGSRRGGLAYPRPTTAPDSHMGGGGNSQASGWVSMHAAALLLCCAGEGQAWYSAQRAWLSASCPERHVDQHETPKHQ
jgi:hypothetical protein